MTTTLATAWANRASAPVTMLNLGDSVTERTGAGSMEASYATKLLRLLQADAGIAGGPGWVNSGASGAVDNSLSSFWNPVGSITNGGYLGNIHGTWTVGQAVTITYTGTSVEVHYFRQGGAGTPYTVSDDGVGGTINPYNQTPQDYRGAWKSTVHAHGTHTVTITPAAGDTLVLFGIYVFDGDETNGVHGWEGGRGGQTSGNIAGSISTFAQDVCAMQQPALVTLYLGINDYYQSIDPATYQTNLASIISAVNSYCTVAPSWVICGQYHVTGTPGSYTEAQYRAAAQAVANADTVNRRYVDLSAAGVTLSGDGTHPDAAGHAAIATAVQPAVRDLAGIQSGWSTLVAERWTGTAWTPLVIEEWNGTSWATATVERKT